MNKFLFRSQSSIIVELAAIRASYSHDLIYSVSGSLALRQFFHGKAKLISWVFGKPNHARTTLFNQHSSFNLKRHNRFLCLTPKCESHFKRFSHSNFVPWCIDHDFFTPNFKPNYLPKYFLATGKTNRDYDTLIKAARFVDAEIRIIGPAAQKPSALPNNVRWTNTSESPPDKAIDYPSLKRWYNNCVGVCVPLSGDANDTCGYTNMLEGMSMAKPVLMTDSGCLHLNPESGNYGLRIKPQDSKGWSNAMNHTLRDSKFAAMCGINGRNIIKTQFTIKRFNRDVISLVEDTFRNSD